MGGAHLRLLNVTPLGIKSEPGCGQASVVSGNVCRRFRHVFYIFAWFSHQNDSVQIFWVKLVFFAKVVAQLASIILLA